MNNPFADPYMVLSGVYTGGKYIKQALSDVRADPKRAALTTRISYGVLEKDTYLDFIIDANTERSPKRSVRLILKIALYALEFTGMHAYTAVDCAVDLAKRAGKGGASGFVNAFLRSYSVPPLPEKADERLSVSASAPLWLAGRMRRTYRDEAYDILTAPSEGVCVRFERHEEKYLGREHLETPFPHTYIFPSFVRDGGYDAGDYTFQSVGSAAVCDAVEGCGSLLDACAAPGGKSVLLAKKCGRVTAQELYPHRAMLIESYIRRMGTGNVFPVCGDAEVYRPEWDSAFDAVLCDVPCTGSGVINENPDIKLFREEGDVLPICARQAAILENSARYVKRGGSLYYSTCSVLPEENDSAVIGLLESRPDFCTAGISSPLAHRETRCGLQFLPHISMGAGFYVSRLVRT